MALGSCAEVRVQLEYCKDLVYISEEQYNELDDEYTQLTKMLTTMLKSW